MGKQHGWTLTELIICVAMFFMIALVGFTIYTAVHFILKFW